MRRLSLLFLATAATFVAAPAAAADTVTNPFPGVQHLHRTTTNPKRNINVLTVDLCAAGVSFRATGPNEKGKKTSAFATSVDAEAAVNGDFFKSGFGLERGIAVGNGVAWPPSTTPEDESVGQLAFGEGRVELIRDSVKQGVEPWMKEVVGGRPTLLHQGELTDTSSHPNLCLRNPRTAVGLTEDKRTMFVVVVDGRATARVGMSCTELAEFMKDLGAHDALAFDGGGSSTMWLKGRGIVNHPSDGKERTVSNHLTIFAKGTGDPMACAAPPSTPLREDDPGITLPAEDESTTPAESPSASDAHQAEGCNASNAPVQSSLIAAGLALLGLVFVRRRR